MKITQTLTTLYVQDCEQSAPWYTTLLGRPFDASPMPSCREWNTSPGAILQVISNPQRAGKNAVAFVIDDFEATLSTLRAQAIPVGDVREIPGFIHWVALRDPEGNEITLVKSLVRESL